jgi:hypothetical protein
MFAERASGSGAETAGSRDRWRSGWVADGVRGEPWRQAGLAVLSPACPPAWVLKVMIRIRAQPARKVP